MINLFYEILANLPLLAIFAALIITSTIFLGGSGGFSSSDGTSDHGTNSRHKKLPGVSDGDRIIKRQIRKHTIGERVFYLFKNLWIVLNFLAVISGLLQLLIYLNFLPPSLG